jgi:ATP-dependent DNA ligase
VGASVLLSPVSFDPNEAAEWLEERGTGRDGVMAKRADQPYRSGKRDGMVKVKARRTADCVVGGFRYLKAERQVGSLLLGLYDEAGLLDHVGFTSTIRRDERASLTAQLEMMVEQPGFTGKAPGGPSRWSTDRSGDWQPVRPELVVEVGFDHVSGGRFRHGTTLLRFRPDKAPRQCDIKQMRR